MMRRNLVKEPFVRWMWVLSTAVWLAAIDSYASVGVWKTYTAKKEVRDVTLTNDVAWAATSGGLFSYNMTDGSFHELTTSEGLRLNDLTALATDHSGNVWIGASNGFLHSYSPRSRRWQYITDLVMSPPRRIHRLRVLGDTLFIASELGLSAYDIPRNEFPFTTEKFGAGADQTGNPTSVALFRDTLWVGTSSGIASAPRRHSNLSAPDSWRVWRTSNGLPSNATAALAVWNNRLYAATNQGLAEYTGTSWSRVPSTAGRNIVGIAGGGDRLHLITSGEVLALDAEGNISSLGSSFSSPLTSLASAGSMVVLGSSRNGLYRQRDGEWESLVPKGPPTNRIVGIVVDEDGRLWAGTGITFGEGFMSFDGRQWRSYTQDTFPQLSTNNYYKVNLGKDNVKWVSSWGAGVVAVDAQGQVLKTLTTANGLPPTFPFPRPFAVVAAVVTDRDGKAWICMRTGNGDTTFVIVQHDSTLSYVVGPPPGPAPVFGDAVIDGNGTIWLVNAKISPGTNFGVYFYNDRGFPGNPATKWSRLTREHGLSSDKTLVAAVDLSGDVWIGTDAGINILLRPYSVRPQVASYYPLREQQINAIAVDPLNAKWVATNQGVFVLSPDGTNILSHYNVENTAGKLVDNNIVSIAIDGRSGTVYFGSEQGLSSLTTAAVAPARTLDEIIVAPNPFYLPSSQPLAVDGLVQNSLLKILSIDGKLIKELRTPGGRIGYWDGTDSEGNDVSSGIYIIVAYSENGSQVAAGKVAVLRR